MSHGGVLYNQLQMSDFPCSVFYLFKATYRLAYKFGFPDYRLPCEPIFHWSCNLSGVCVYWQSSLSSVLILMQHPHLVSNHAIFSGLLKVWLFRPAGVLLQIGLKWAEMVLNKSCLLLVQKYLTRCSRDRAALLLPVPLNRKGIANFKKTPTTTIYYSL